MVPTIDSNPLLKKQKTTQEQTPVKVSAVNKGITKKEKVAYKLDPKGFH